MDLVRNPDGTMRCGYRSPIGNPELMGKLAGLDRPVYFICGCPAGQHRDGIDCDFEDCTIWRKYEGTGQLPSYMYNRKKFGYTPRRKKSA